MREGALQESAALSAARRRMACHLTPSRICVSISMMAKNTGAITRKRERVNEQLLSCLRCSRTRVWSRCSQCDAVDELALEEQIAGD